MSEAGVSDARAGRARWTRAMIVAALVVGFALRLGFAFCYWQDKPLTLDEQEYLLLSTSLARGDGLTYPPASAGAPRARHFERPPVFAVFLASVLRATGDPLASAPIGPDGLPQGFPRSSSDVPGAIKVAQSAVGVLVIALIAALARRGAGSRAAAAAAVLAAVYPPLTWVCAYVLAEPLYAALALATVWCLDASVRTSRTDYVRVAAAGALCGIAILTKEAILFFLPFAAVWLLAKRRMAAACVLALGLAAVVGPWVARNYAVHGRFVLTAAHGGVTFWTGNNAWSPGEGDLAANPEMGRARVAFEERHADLDPRALDGAYYQEALAFIRSHPVAWLGLEARKLFYAFVPIGPSYRLHSARYFLGSVISYGLVFPFGVLGMLALLGRAGRSPLTPLWLLAASSVAVCLVFFPQERFRIPVIDPACLVGAAAWLSPGGRPGWLDRAVGAGAAAPTEQ